MANNNSSNNSNRGGKNGKNGGFRGVLTLIVWALVLTVAFQYFNAYNNNAANKSTSHEIKYSDMISMIEKDQVKEILFKDSTIYVTPVDGYVFTEEVTSGSKTETKTYTQSKDSGLTLYTVYLSNADLLPLLEAHNVAYTGFYKAEMSPFLMIMIQYILPTIFIVGAFMLVMRLMSKSGGGGFGGIGSVGKANAKVYMEKSTGVTFKDVAGQDEAKESLEEIIDFLHNPGKYTAIGAKLPKGALLVGSPGTGKTLLAKAVAGEAGVPFFSISGSDFVEMFVGVGASRVRDLFEQAKQKAPCILFIDEIDAIGRARGKNAGFSGNDERENTLNQLLTEMDGFQTNTGVIVLAATNRVDILDKALMRAGRFDRQIEVGLPDVKEREEIFDVHLRPLKLDPELDRTFLAKQTPGFSGADIANVCNEAALIAARHNKKYVSREDFLAAIDRIIGGLERKNKIISDEEKRVIAYHEAGHATVSWILENASPLIKVTIIPRGKSLGAAWYLPEERQITTREQMMDELAAMLGGRVSEQINFGEVSTGALNDLERATKMAYAMVAYYGMSEKVGTISYYDSTGQSDMALTKPYSELTSQQIDAEAKNTIAEAYAMAAEVLRSHADGLKELAELLLEREVVFTEDVERIFGKRKKDILRERKEAEQKALAERKAASGDAEEAAGKKEVAPAESRKDEEKISGTAASAVSDGKSSAETPEV